MSDRSRPPAQPQTAYTDDNPPPYAPAPTAADHVAGDDPTSPTGAAPDLPVSDKPTGEPVPVAVPGQRQQTGYDPEQYRPASGLPPVLPPGQVPPSDHPPVVNPPHVSPVLDLRTDAERVADEERQRAVDELAAKRRAWESYRRDNPSDTR